MKLKIVLWIPLVLVAAGLVWYVSVVGGGSHEMEEMTFATLPALPDSPLNASYKIEGTEVQLVDGVADVEIVPGSASRAVTRIWREPLYADLNGDSKEDAVMVLTHEEGGSGTFYYLAVAVHDESGFLGSEALFLGDRIGMHDVSLLDDVVVLQYNDRGDDAAVSDEPAVFVTRYFTVQGILMLEHGPYAEGIEIVAGTVVWGHESREFQPCDGDVYWIASSSRSVKAIEAVYNERARDSAPYTPVYMLLAGSVEDAPQEGFAAEYEAAFEVQGILSAPEDGVCASKEDAESADVLQSNNT